MRLAATDVQDIQKTMHIAVIEKYEIIKERVELLQQGEWQKDKELANMSIGRIEELVELFEGMQLAGFENLLTIYRKHYKRIN